MEKTYSIPINWVQSGLVTTKAETLEKALDTVNSLELSSLGLIGQTIPSSTRVSFPLLKDYVKDEVLCDDIMLYTSTKVPDCPFCEKAREFFNKHKLTFTELSIDTDDELAKRIFARTGNMSLPQIEFGNEVFVGFQEPRIHAALVRYGHLEASEDSAPTVPVPGQMPMPPTQATQATQVPLQPIIKPSTQTPTQVPMQPSVAVAAASPARGKVQQVQKTKKEQESVVDKIIETEEKTVTKKSSKTVENPTTKTTIT